MLAHLGATSQGFIRNKRDGIHRKITGIKNLGTGQGKGVQKVLNYAKIVDKESQLR